MIAITSEFPVPLTAAFKEVRLKDDNWIGETDSAERRRRQNRLHQRAWRRRQKEKQDSSSTHPLVNSEPLRDQKELATRPSNDSSVRQRLARDHVSGLRRMAMSFELPQSRAAFWRALMPLGEPQAIFAYWADLSAHRKREISSPLLLQPSLLDSEPYDPSIEDAFSTVAEYTHPTQALGPCLDTNSVHDSCTSTFSFPLSADHKLFVLIQYNALRGVMTNMSILLHLSGSRLDGWANQYTEDLPIPPDSAPLSLKPTYLQKTVPHESWIGVIPYPTLRENIIRNQSSIDTDALCNDFLGGMYEGLSEIQDRGMVLWGQPWSHDGWEVSEGFVRKWSFLLAGCEDLFKSTNRWREIRGEERLFTEV